MIAAISERAAELEKLCVQHHVQRLDLFGSAVTGDHRQGASDLDFLVEFQPLPAGGRMAMPISGCWRLWKRSSEILLTSLSTRRFRIPSSGNALRRPGHSSMQLEAKNYLFDICS